MPLELGDSFKETTEEPQISDPVLWFLKVFVDMGSDVRPPTILPITKGDEEITWPSGGLPADPEPETVWYPFPFSFSPVEQGTDGSLTQIDCTIDNSNRLLMPILFDAAGLEGNTVELYAVPKKALAIASPSHEFQKIELRVANASANMEAVTFRLSFPDWFKIGSPVDRYEPSNCRNDFGDPQTCGYVINQFAGFTTCPKNYAACVARGVDMIARGLGAILPRNYRGYPGISERR